MRSLRSRLFASFAAAVLLSVVLTVGVASVLTSRRVVRVIQAGLARQAGIVAAQISDGDISPLRLRPLRRAIRLQGEVLLIRPAGHVSELDAGAAADLAAGRPVQGTASLFGAEYLIAAERSGDNVVIVGRLAGLGGDVRPFLGSLLLAGLGGALVAALAAYLLSQRLSRPIRRVSEAAGRLAAGEDPGQIPVEGRDELAGLAASFNDMARDLSASREAERAFLLSVSHELKTPLTSIRGYAEALREQAIGPDEAASVIEGESDRLERLVRDLLDLARVGRKEFSIRREPVDLADVARDAVDRYAHRAVEFDVALTAGTDGPALVAGDRDRVLQVVSNLVENALRVTPAGGRVEVRSEGRAIEVADTGPGLTAEDAARAFERFYLFRRYGEERPVGSGLGLAVVRELVGAMDGDVAVDARPGEGATFRVTLPGV